MKVAIQCDSPLLQRSLELFLEGHLSSRRHCDILIRDKAIGDDEYPTLLISTDVSADLRKPFSKAELLDALRRKLHTTVTVQSVESQVQEIEKKEETFVDFSILEKHIEKLTQEYQTNILKAVRAFYEK